jgi:choline dehydrogenase-like flavoprotein
MYFGRQQWGYFAAPNGYWDMPSEPYTVAQGSQWRWFRSRILGGRTNHYGRISLRFSDYDFQPEDGLSDAWPVTYEEMSPWYDKRRLACDVRRDVAVVRQGRRLHGRHGHQGGPAHRARRQLPAGHPAARA